MTVEDSGSGEKLSSIEYSAYKWGVTARAPRPGSHQVLFWNVNLLEPNRGRGKWLWDPGDSSVIRLDDPALDDFRFHAVHGS